MSELTTWHATTSIPQTQHAPETFQNRTPGTQNSEEQIHLTYIVTGGVTGGCLLLLGMMVVVFLLWRRRRRRNVADIEVAQEKGDGIYNEIAEARKHKKKKGKKEKKTKGKQWDQDNNNAVSAIELIAIDAAPDIITAHDNESIYETLDGRRAARAKANHMTMESQSEHCCITSPVHGSYLMTEGAVDCTYDHLHRFHKPRSSHLHQAILEKRFTDPEVTTRPKLPPKPRLAHSADEATRAGEGPGRRHSEDSQEMDTGCGGAVDWFSSNTAKFPADNVRSSLTELARQSVSDGKRIVCQLTMVGVVENGKPVPVKPPSASNAYFILEPSRDSAEVCDDPSLRSPAPKFRVRSEVSKHDDHKDGDVDAGASDYFVLEPLEPQNDLPEFVGTQHLQKFKDCGKRDFHDICSEGGEHGSQWSQHGHHVVGSFHGMEDRQDNCSLQSFTRFHSCPAECCNTENSDTGPPLPPKTFHYHRSLSSPQSSQDKETYNESSPIQKKMDAEILKARIQQEMIALGFVDDTDTHNNVDETAGTASNFESQNSDIVVCPERPATNNYYVLEPQLGAEDEDQTKPDPAIPPSTSFGGNSDGSKPRYHPRQQAPSPAPRLPRRNGHNRSRSETPAMNSEEDQSGEQGPVIVTLKKNRPVGKEGGDGAAEGRGHRNDDHRDPFRPRFTSEAGVLAHRLKRR